MSGALSDPVLHRRSLGKLKSRLSLCNPPRPLREGLRVSRIIDEAIVGDTDAGAAILESLSYHYPLGSLRSLAQEYENIQLLRTATRIPLDLGNCAVPTWRGVMGALSKSFPGSLPFWEHR